MEQHRKPSKDFQRKEVVGQVGLHLSYAGKLENKSALMGEGV